MTQKAACKIIKVRLLKLDLKMAFPFRVAYGSTTSAQVNIVELSDEAGNQGLGEAAAASYFSAEQKSATWSYMNDLCNQLPMREPTDLLKESAFLASPKHDDDALQIAKVAIETALWDLKCNQQGETLSTTLGGRANGVRVTDITLPLLDPNETIAFADYIAPMKVSVIKVKVSGDIERDIQRLTIFLKRLPYKVSFFLDGNQAFSVDSAKIFLTALESENLTPPLFFEQPLPKDSWCDLKKLSQTTEVPICLDESISSFDDLKRCIDDNVAPMINLKVMKSGISEVIKLAKKATESGIDMMIGGMVETEITMSTSLQIMSVFPAIKYADLDTPFFIAERVCLDSPWHKQSCNLEVQRAHALQLKPELVPVEEKVFS